MMLPNPQVMLLCRVGVWLFCFVFIGLNAAAQTVAVDAASVSQRMSQMERRLMALEKTRFSGTGAAVGGTAVADMELRLQDLENEISSLNGAVERLSKVVQTLAEKMDSQQRDLEMRLQDLEKGGGASGHSSSGTGAGAGHDGAGTGSEAAVSGTHGATEGEIAGKTAGEAGKAAESGDGAGKGKTNGGDAGAKGDASVPDGLSAQEIYSKGYGYLTAADYAKAKAWLGTLVARYPKDNLADNGYYWLGEIALVQNNPSEAAVQFKKGLEAFPKGQKAPGNMLKMGVALEKLGKADLAKGMWQKLMKDYPSASEVVKAKEYLAKLAKAPDAAPVSPSRKP